MYFSINVENEMNFHDTAKEAKECAEKELDSCRGPDGWEVDEDDICQIRWGQMLGIVKHVPVDDPDHWQFELKRCKSEVIGQ